jgi:hypothetical protein
MSSETLFELSERHADERRKMLIERAWRKRMLQMGCNRADVIADLEERLQNLPIEETNELRDQRRADELERIRRENKAHRERIANVRTKVDDDTEDDATGEARARARSVSIAKRQASAEALQQANVQHNRRMSSVQAAVDDDVMDDAAGRARVQFAEESRERKEAEAQQLAEANRQHEAKIAAMTAVTDDMDPRTRPR